MKHLKIILPMLSIATATLASTPVPTILSTDIGSDIDDTWALAYLLKSPELDLKMVLTETGDATYRGKITAKFLEVSGRTDVDVALGISNPKMSDRYKTQRPWIRDYELDTYPGTVHQNGVQAVIDFIRASEGPVNVIAIGPPPSLAKAIALAPDIAEKCRFFGMYGSIDKGYGGSPEPSWETNVAVDPAAFRVVISANWKSSTITPLDTCGIVSLKDDNYRRIWCATDDPMLRALIENYCLWAPLVPWGHCDYFTQKSSTLFDTVAVYMAYSEEFLNFEEVSFSVTDKGFTPRDPNGPYRARVAISWKDLEAFERHLTQRLLGEK